jgi:hypothetical protein
MCRPDLVAGMFCWDWSSGPGAQIFDLLSVQRPYVLDFLIPVLENVNACLKLDYRERMVVASRPLEVPQNE